MASRVKPSKKKCWKKFFFLNLEKKIWKKNFRKKMLEKKFWKKNFGKINSKTKIFITKLYSNIDKCYIIFALLAPFDKIGRKTESNENVCGIWFKIGSVARSLDARNAANWTESGENIYHGLRAVGNSLPHERYLLHRWYEILVPGLPLR